MESQTITASLHVLGKVEDQHAFLLSKEATDFIYFLHEKFNASRLQLLQKRQERQRNFNSYQWPSFLGETAAIRKSDWMVAPIPEDLQDRRVEITGPVDRKMVINALNSGAKVFMADFEDANSPTWLNCLEGQHNLYDAVRGTISFQNPEGKVYHLNEQTAVLKVRPRGWHLSEKHVLIDGEPIAASLFDFGIFFFHNAKALMAKGSGPYFYLPKLESHLEARLWNEVFIAAQSYLDIPRGSIKATVLIETITAAFEMEEIIFELKEHMAGLNAGRWDYIFSVIKKFHPHKSFVLPDRAEVGMNVPFMSAYAQLLVKTCHKRGAHAIGGMAAFIPSKDEETNQKAFEKVKNDKEREAKHGYDGTWVAHPALVPIAREVFDRYLTHSSHQKNILREDVLPSAEALLSINKTPGKISLEGVKTNIRVCILYMAHWLNGQGAVAIHHLMEDAATAEISRAQLWQWMHHELSTAEGLAISGENYKAWRAGILDELLKEYRQESFSAKLIAAAQLLDEMIFSDQFEEFLTIPAYQLLD